LEAPRGLAWSAGLPATSHPIAARELRLSWAWPVGCILAVLYASLLPFDFIPTAFGRMFADGLSHLRFRTTTPDDAAANMLVYLPVGLLVAMYLVGKRFSRWVGVVAAIGVGTALSVVVEWLQTGLASRVASCTDIVLNVLGTSVGACLGVGLHGTARAAWAQLRYELADRPFTTAASMLTLGLFLYNLAPFDFVMTTDALHASFGHAQWGLFNARPATPGAAPFASIAHQLAGAGWFAVLGYLLGLAGRERGRYPTSSLACALKDGLVLVALVEFMQLFTKSHTFDAATVMIRSLGVILGAWCAVFMIDPLTGSAWRRSLPLALPTGLAAILAAFQAGLLLAPCVNPQGGTLSGLEAMSIRWLPFEALWRQPLPVAAGEMLSDLFTYGTLALTLGVLLRRFRIPQACWWSATAAILAAIACEALHAASFARPLDTTTAVSACLAAGLIAHAGHTFRPNTDHPHLDGPFGASCRF